MAGHGFILIRLGNGLKRKRFQAEQWQPGHHFVISVHFVADDGSKELPHKAHETHDLYYTDFFEKMTEDGG